jgi:hypothetical protein
MAKNQDKTKNDIYNYFKSNGYEPVLKSTNGKEVSVPEEAEVIEFQFKVDDENYGTAAISLDNEGQLKVFYSDKIEQSPTSSEHGEVTWNELIPTLRKMTFGKTKSFELDDMDNLEYDMAKREHSKKLEEGYYPMGKKASYSDNIPECKIVIKHNRNIEEGEQRYRNIHQIFIENALGERFLAPTTKPGLARVYARHIAEGGKVNDDKWNHITGLCEEYSKMAGFIRATRNGQFNEDTQRLVSAGTEHYISLRESLHKLAGKRGYNNYFESWAPPLMESEGDEDLSEMFMNSSLDPRIESVIPILNRLNKNISENQEIKEVVALEAWADDVAEGVYSHDVERAFPNGKASGVKSHPAVVKTNKPIGTRVADIGKGGKEHNVKTDKEWDKQKGVAEGLPQTLRKVVPGYAKREIDKKMDAGKFGKTDADKDANFQRYKKIQDKLKEQGVAEGRPEDLPGIDYDRPGDSPHKKSGKEHNPYPFSKEEDDEYFNNIFRKQREAKLKKANELQHMQKLSDEDVKEDIGPQQAAVGQLGATAKVNAGGTILGNPERSQKGLRGKLVGGATESVDPTLSRIKKLSGL